MPVTDPIADSLTMLRNASRAHKDKVTLGASKAVLRITELLKEEGFIENVKPFEEGKKKFVRVHLKYLRDGRPAIQGIQRISKPGLRQYKGVTEIPRVQGGLGVMIISTSRGIVTDRQARKEKVGGELLCKVW